MDIKDVKAPVDPALDISDFFWVFVILAIGMIAALGVFLYRRYRARPVAPPPPIVPVPPWDIALRQLNDLAYKQYPEKGMFKQYYIALSDIARHYLEDRFTIRAAEMTTEEFLNYTKTTAVLTSGQKEILKDFLSGCDMVKFAKHQPLINDAKTHFDLVRKLIEETKG